jgi:hypothetical protein
MWQNLTSKRAVLVAVGNALEDDNAATVIVAIEKEA